MQMLRKVAEETVSLSSSDLKRQYCSKSPKFDCWCVNEVLVRRTKRSVLNNFANFTGKHLCWSLFLIKLQACHFIKKRFRHRCFPVNTAKFLRTPILKNIYKRLFLTFLLTSCQTMARRKQVSSFAANKMTPLRAFNQSRYLLII